MREILLYGAIWEFTAETLIEKINEVPDDEDIKIRLNCPGGSVFAGWSIIGKIKERKGKVFIAVDGYAASMAFMICAFGEDVEALDVSRFMIHKASGYIRRPEDQQLLDNVNAELLAKLKKRIDLKKFKEVLGFTLESIFKAEDEKDVWITAKQAKEIGLISNIVRIDPKKITAYTNQIVAFVETDPTGQGSPVDPQGSEIDGEGKPQGSEKPEEKKINVKQKPVKKMTANEFKASDPQEYNEILALGNKAGIKAEQERVKSWLAFIDIDKEGVLKAVKEGTPFTQSVMAEMTVKMTSKKEVKKIEDDSPDGTPTDPPEGKTPEEKEITAFEDALDGNIKVENLVI